MRTTFIVATAPILSSSLVFAQNAGTGSTTTTGDAAISTASPNPSSVSENGINCPNPGSGASNGALNNGTTGDTIGTGKGIENGPAPSPLRK